MKKMIYITSAVVLLFVIAGGIYAYYLYNEAEQTVDEDMHIELERNEAERNEPEAPMEEQDPVSFLLLGLDAEDSTDGLSDVIMVVTINPVEDTMKMISLPRDTMVEIPGFGEDKINHAYGFGGADLTIETVEDYLDIPLHYFVSINMDGFEEMVDALGGVTVENQFSFEQDEHVFEEGEIELDGERALAYARMRDEDESGDIGRNERQRQILQAMIEEGAQLSSLTRGMELMNVMSNYVNTSIDFDKMRTLQQDYASARHNQTTLTFDIDIYEDGEMIDNVWYLIIPEEERERVSIEFQEHLALTDN